MTCKEVLDKATECVLNDRQNSYGTPEDSFGRIAQYWSLYLDTPVTPADVAVLLMFLKIARIEANPQHADNWVDIAGYAACGSEVADKNG